MQCLNTQANSIYYLYVYSVTVQSIEKRLSQVATKGTVPQRSTNTPYTLTQGVLYIKDMLFNSRTCQDLKLKFPRVSRSWKFWENAVQ